MSEAAAARLLLLAPAALLAFFLGIGLVVLIRPWLLRHAVARPNARSSHDTPVPQGGGIAVVLATLAVTWGAILFWPHSHWQTEQFAIASAAAILLTILGALDDMHALPATVRLIAQCIAVGAVVIALPHDMRLLPQLPWWMDRACLLVAGVWFVNLTNFMDGIDWMTAAEVVPVAGAMVLLGILGDLDSTAAVIAATLLGAMLGFAPFNKPVARLFLGDAGSLPIGLLLGWLLMQLALAGHRAAAIVLPLYYVADATITLLRRLMQRESFWLSHRTHFYQRATDNGFTVTEIVTRVFLVNLALAVLALISVLAGDPLVSLLTLCVAAVLVAALLMSFARIKR